MQGLPTRYSRLRPSRQSNVALTKATEGTHLSSLSVALRDLSSLHLRGRSMGEHVATVAGTSCPRRAGAQLDVCQKRVRARPPQMFVCTFHARSVIRAHTYIFFSLALFAKKRVCFVGRSDGTGIARNDFLNPLLGRTGCRSTGAQPSPVASRHLLQTRRQLLRCGACAAMAASLSREQR